MLLIILILLNISIVKNPHLCIRKYWDDSRGDENLLELQTQQPKHQIYTMKALIKCDEIKQNNKSLDEKMETFDKPFINEFKRNIFPTFPGDCISKCFISFSVKKVLFHVLRDFFDISTNSKKKKQIPFFEFQIQ